MTEPITVTLEDVTQHLRDLASERPTYVYPKRGDGDSIAACLYVYEDKPDCIVGHVLNRIGVPIDTIRSLEGNLADVVFRRLIDNGIIAPLGIEEESRLQRLTHAVQRHQDEGYTWAESVRLVLEPSIP